jgi:hypothetical protein
MASGLDLKPYERYVQSGKVDGQFASGAFTGLFAGPPRLANVGGAVGVVEGGRNIVQPIGLLQQWNLSQNSQFNRAYELGSERSYFIRGRTMGQIQLGSIYYHGPSLLRMMYAYYSDLIPPTVVPSYFANIGAATMSNPHDVKVAPGYENLYLNLASDLFSQPIGLMCKIMDSNEDTIGGMYFEACNIPNHSIGTDANGTVIQEQASVQYERSVPVALSSVALIKDSALNILNS